ncbi:amidohydrolase (plasmid) [Streptomyces sp. HUAS 31]|uniref:amidohydrolase n=1 Tax=Streptomyces TaxID=1883 RepID=UPI0023052093|nr:amidohydrolase [Streptomyces sp. HUAS 31]WCE02483.1 amidohydrolase [Streptomyces sp. HUAS 31]
MNAVPPVAPLLAGLAERLPGLRTLYEDLHAHPELSFQELRTARVVAQRLREQGWRTTEGVGGTGVVGVLSNGDGPVVLLRADMDALPIEEETGLPYASTAKGTDASGGEVPVMHACGHDMHVTCLLGATDRLAAHREHWRGTVLAVFQPAEEVGGAATMIADGFAERFPRPDICLAQHVTPMPAGTIAIKPGPIMAAADFLRITFFGHGGHGSLPETTVDPIVTAAATIMRLQTIVSREVGANQSAVLTVGSVHAGSKENIIPDSAELTVGVRTTTAALRERVLASVRRIANAESAATGCPSAPRITPISAFPVTDNDPAAAAAVRSALVAAVGEDRVLTLQQPVPASEDFGMFGTGLKAPSVYWCLGGTDPALFPEGDLAPAATAEVPSNHSARFAPVPEPTIEAGTTALLAAAARWLRSDTGA